MNKSIELEQYEQTNLGNERNMNKLKLNTFKYKTSASDDGFLDKISKRYSTYRFLRKSPGRKNAIEQPVSGSYDMTGHESDDHKLEIGAPVLISKTTLGDSDHEADGPTGPRINDGVRVSDSARSTTGTSFGGELKFSFLAPAARNSRTDVDDDDDQDYDIPRPSVNVTNGCYGDDGDEEYHCIRSQSAMNLSHSDALQMELFGSCADDTTINASAMERAAHSPVKSQSIGNICAGEDPLAQSTPIAQPPFKSSNMSVNRGSISAVNSVRGHSVSRASLGANSSIGDNEFDLKSASCHSLNARNIFLSIEELNDITKQINEAEDLQPRDDHLEYCAHRDNLRPVERRITLLRNKNNRLINIGSRRDKITNAWSGFKSWIGEEKGKLRSVVQRHASLQRVGANFRSNSGSTATLANGGSGAEVASTSAEQKESSEQVDTSTGGAAMDGDDQADNHNRRISTGQDSMASEFSSLDGDCRRVDSLKKRKSCESRTDGKRGSQTRGRTSKEGWEVKYYPVFWKKIEICRHFSIGFEVFSSLCM